MPEPTEQMSPERTARAAVVRAILGILQMAFAAGSFVLLVTTGVNRNSLIGVIVTSMLTGVSISFFGARSRRVPTDGS